MPIVNVVLASMVVAAQPSSDGQPKTVKLPASLAQVLNDYERAWENQDAKALAALFVAEGLVMSTHRPPVQGRPAIEKHYAGAGGPIAFRPFAYAQEGGLGTISGGFSMKPGQPDIGKFTLVLRRVETGRWMILSDIENMNQPPPIKRPAAKP
ncbi:MAG: nuclear transport factor 2 family protein [Myxococcota bacterium]